MYAIDRTWDHRGEYRDDGRSQEGVLGGIIDAGRDFPVSSSSPHGDDPPSLQRRPQLQQAFSGPESPSVRRSRCRHRADEKSLVICRRFFSLSWWLHAGFRFLIIVVSSPSFWHCRSEHRTEGGYDLFTLFMSSSRLVFFNRGGLATLPFLYKLAERRPDWLTLQTSPI